MSSVPPQTIISLPVHTAVWANLPEGALVVLVAVQLLMLGSYVAPVLIQLLCPPIPPQTIISLPVHTAVCWSRASGALVVLVPVQLSVLGLYLAPLLVPPG